MAISTYPDTSGKIEMAFSTYPDTSGKILPAHGWLKLEIRKFGCLCRAGWSQCTLTLYSLVREGYGQVNVVVFPLYTSRNDHIYKDKFSVNLKKKNNYGEISDFHFMFFSLFRTKESIFYRTGPRRKVVKWTGTMNSVSRGRLSTCPRSAWKSIRAFKSQSN